MNFRIQLFAVISLFTVSAAAQNNALILNNAVVINLNAGGVLSINQSNAAGISLIGTGTGFIQSENETNRVAWLINSGTGSFVIPFGVAATGSKIDMSYNITTAGSSSGTLIASTYATANNNTVYPAVYSPVVANMNLLGSGGDQSLSAVDRFWILRKENWTSNPASSLTFSYRDVEFAPSNTISESGLLAQYWNGTQWTPSWNSGTALFGVNNAAANQVNSIDAGSGNFYTWMLAEKPASLPVEIASIDADCNYKGNPVIRWATLSETNNHYFTIERSSDALSWDNVAEIPGAGNSNTPLFYNYTDSGTINQSFYYKLSQTDFDGTESEGWVIEAKCSNNINTTGYNIFAYSDDAHVIHMQFFNPDESPALIRIFDMRGRLVFLQQIAAVAGQNEITVSNLFQDAVYMISINGNRLSESKKVFLQ